MTTHREFLDLAAASIDFPLSVDEERRLAGHLATCPTCASEVAGFRDDAIRLGDFGISDAPPRLGDAVRRLASMPRRRQPRRPIVLLAAALVLVGGLVAQSSAVGGFLGQILRTVSPSPLPHPGLSTALPLSSVKPQTAVPSPAASASVTVGPRPSGLFGTGLSWRTTSAIEGVAGGQMNDVTSFGSGFVAVGAASGGGAVWTSIDGLAWKIQVLPNAAPLLQVAAGPSLIVAIGGDQIWLSADGTTWSPAPNPPARGAFLVDVAVGLHGYTAVGRTGVNSTTAAVWTSSDGFSWTRVPSQDAFNAVCPAGIADAVNGLVLVGDDCATLEPHAVALFSVDGATWEEEATAGEFAGALAAVAGSDRRFIAIGGVNGPSRPTPVVYSSDDGRAWTRRRTFSDPTFVEEIVAVTRLGSGYIAVGLRDRGSQDAPTTLISRDGLSWDRGDLLPIPTGAASSRRTVTGIAALADQVVIVGGYGDGSGDAGAVTWTAYLGR